MSSPSSRTALGFETKKKSVGGDRSINRPIGRQNNYGKRKVSRIVK
jgi:hypothetical protein